MANINFCGCQTPTTSCVYIDVASLPTPTMASIGMIYGLPDGTLWAIPCGESEFKQLSTGGSSTGGLTVDVVRVTENTGVVIS